jgi:hypothetical protein
LWQLGGKPNLFHDLLKSFDFCGLLRLADAFHVDISALCSEREVDDVRLPGLVSKIIDNQCKTFLFFQIKNVLNQVK